MKYIAHIDDNRKPGGSNRDIKRTYNLEVRNRDKEGFDIVGTQENLERFVEDYGIFLQDDIVETK